MARIKIMGEPLQAGKPKHLPKSNDLSSITERFQAGGKHKLTLDKSFKRSDGRK